MFQKNLFFTLSQSRVIIDLLITSVFFRFVPLSCPAKNPPLSFIWSFSALVILWYCAVVYGVLIGFFSFSHSSSKVILSGCHFDACLLFPKQKDNFLIAYSLLKFWLWYLWHNAYQILALSIVLNDVVINSMPTTCQLNMSINKKHKINIWGFQISKSH